MIDDDYSAGEVAFLLSLSRDDAEDMSVSWADSVGSASADSLPSSTSHEWDPVLLIARWCEVDAARRRVMGSRAEARILHMRLVEEQTEREIAAATGLSQPTVHRRWRSMVDEVVDELHGRRDRPTHLQLLPTLAELAAA